MEKMIEYDSCRVKEERMFLHEMFIERPKEKSDVPDYEAMSKEEFEAYIESMLPF